MFLPEPGDQMWYNMPEDEAFIHVLDLLEMQDEFDSSTQSDRDSEAGDDLSSMASDLDDDEEEWDPRDETCWKLKPLDLNKAIQDLRARRLPEMEISKKIIRSVIVHYSHQPNVIHVPAPEPGSRFVVVGDLHGHFGDLIHLLEDHGEPSPGPKGAVRFLFNGDFVDRGTWGPEVLLLLYAMKIKFPTAVFLNRGNHEDQSQNQLPDNGFVHSHCTRAFGAEALTMYYLCRKSFKELPLCHVIGGEVFVVHGGLPMDPMVTLTDVNGIDRRHDVPIKHCALMGYPKGQKVVAKKDLQGKDGEKVFKGSKGRLCERVRKSNEAIVKFSGGGVSDEVVVRIFGAPELEEDVDILYASEKERLRQRQHRIFVSLLWSDPVAKPGMRGPSKRGAGAFFDSKITQEFLKVNKLKVLLRSHEKRQDGFSVEHANSKGHMIAATVFSASNYPKGAGEPAGNKAAVVVMEPKEPGNLSASLISWPAWRVGFQDGLMAPNLLSDELKSKFQEAQAALTLGPRARALAKLRELTYCSRPQLLSYWQALDTEATGVIEREHWARAMRAVVITDDEFPWEWLEPYMLRHQGNSPDFNYAVFLSQYGNSLARKLASRFYGGSMMAVLPGVKSREDIERAWSAVDRNGDGRLSYQELRPILRASSGVTDAADKITMEDHIYSLLMVMDKDKTGFVDREEFIGSVLRFLNCESLIAESFSLASFEQDEEGKQAKDDAKEHSRGGVRKGTTQMEEEMAHWTDEEISQCWASTQGVIRALSTTTGCASAVFQVLDEDSDGAIDREEFRRGLRQLLAGNNILRNINVWEPLLWKLVDEDCSGVVSPHEMNLAFSVRETLSI
ncbi:unnamed protein product [Effrenium voratum]|nr:unnamed protein product [Effrenium voratum]